MSQPEDKTSDGKPQDGDTKGLKVNVSVSGKEEIEKLKKQLDEALTAKKSAEEDLTKLKDDVTKLTEAKDISDEEKEDLKAKLELIAEKAFKKSKDEFIGQAKDLIPDEQITELESSIDTPEKLDQSRGMLKYIKQAREDYTKAQQEKDRLTKDAEDKAKQAQAAKGTPTGGGAGGKAPLTSEPVVNAETGVKEYSTYEAMIDDIRKREKSKDPAVAAEAHKILNELFSKWVIEIKKDHAKSGFSTIEAKKSFNQMVKEGLEEEKGKTGAGEK